MSFAYMRFYTGDYYRDTRHLSMLQHGAYRQLLDHCWDQKGPLPLDVTKCYRICGAVSKEEQECVQGIVAEFFTRMEDGHYNKRMTEEIRASEAISQGRAEAGKVGGLAKAAANDRALKGRLANAKQMLANAKQVPVSPSPSPSPASALEPTPKKTQETAPVVARSVAPSAPPPPPFAGDSNLENIPPRAIVLIAAAWELPDAWGIDAEALGWKGPSILKEAERFRQYWTVGKGQGKRRTVKGWRQSWSNWLSKAEAMA